MKYSIMVYLKDRNYDKIREEILEAEEYHYHSAWFPDHIQFSDSSVLESWTTFSALATETKRIRLGTLVLCNSFRNPVLLAKMGSTLDNISHGRLELGIGAGWHKKEFESSGYEFLDSGHRINELREAVQIIRRLWTNDSKITFHGQYYNIVNSLCIPKPIQKPCPPIWIGGTGSYITKRLAKYADGINLSRFDLDPETISRLIEYIRQFNKECKISFETTIIISDNKNEIKTQLQQSSKLHIRLANYLNAEYLKKTLHTPRFAFKAITSRFLNLEYPPSFIIGTPEECKERVKKYENAGVDLLIGTFYDIDGIRRFSEAMKL